jgi:ATP-binding cassette, subfamily B, bacterial
MTANIRQYARLVGAAFETDRRLARVVMALTIVRFALIIVMAIGFRTIVDALTAGRWSAAIAGGAVLIVALGLGEWGGQALVPLRLRLQEKVSALLDERLMALTTGVRTVEHHDRPEYLIELEVLRAQHGVLSVVPDAGITLVGGLARLVLTAALLASVQPLLGLLPLASVPALALTARAETLRQRAAERIGNLRRLEYELWKLATDLASASEVRLSGITGDVLQRHRSVRTDVDDIEDSVQGRATALVATGWLAFGVLVTAAVYLLVPLVLAGEVSLGGTVMVLTLASQTNVQVTSLTATFALLNRARTTVRRFTWLEDYARRSAEHRHGQPPARLTTGIRLDQVEFRYPGQDRVVLGPIDLTLPAGSVVAVVGENGAGKTTLVKLLSLMYSPDAGHITVDSTDLERLDPAAWRARLSAGFQDFVRFEFTAGESIGLGDLNRITDDVALGAAVDRSHARATVAKLPDGLASQLGRVYADGVNLSEGEWQRVALARSMMRASPLLLLLDEPTASLDAATEHALFEAYSAAARVAAAELGTITILVSHRFTTVRSADRIVVLDGGQLIEDGTHDELMAAEGRYCELARLQAEGFGQ